MIRSLGGNKIDWPEPPVRNGDLLNHWDRLLWERYVHARIDRFNDVHPAWNEQVMDHSRTCWQRITSCKILKTRLSSATPEELCHAHALLIVVVHFGDLFEQSKSPGALNGGLSPRQDDSKNLERQKRAARKDARLFARMQDLAALLSEPRPALDRDLAEGKRRAEQFNGPGPEAIVFTRDGDESVPEMILAPKPDLTLEKQRRGKPRMSGVELNVYLALVRALVRKSFPNQSCDSLTLALVNHFIPNLLPTSYDENNLHARLSPFYRKDGVEAYLNYLVEQWVVSREVRELYPLPDFLVSPGSLSVADKAR